MNVKKIVVLNIGLWLLCSLAYGQALKPGERMPKPKIAHIYNDQHQFLDLVSLNGKVLLFDFWSPNCIACLLSFPKLDSLQRQFGDQIQIILVNRQTKDSTARFFDRRPHLFRPNLPFVTNDTLLNKLFPNRANPAIAWVDKEGIFHQMTSEITSEAIAIFMNKGEVKAKTYRKRHKYVPTLFDPAYQDSISYHSYISKPIDGVKLNGWVSGQNGIAATDTKLLELYVKAFEENGKYDFRGPGQIVLACSKPPSQELYMRYNYSLQLPVFKQDDLYQTMQDDLKRNFSYRVSIEMRRHRAFVLVRKNSRDMIATSGGEQLFTFKMSSSFSTDILPQRTIRNYPFERFSNVLKNWIAVKFNMLFADEVNYQGNVDIVFDGKIVDNLTRDGLRAELNRIGLDLIEKDIKQWTLVIR